MNYSFWFEVGVLMVGAAIGSLALIPYSLKLLKASANKKPLRMPLQTLVVLSFLQNMVISAITIGAGLFVAHKVGLGAPTIGAIVTGTSLPYSLAHVVLIPLILGLLIGLLIIVIDLAYLPKWPKPILDAAKGTTLLENFYASFYGGLNEEYLSRLFGVSILAWLLSRVWHTSSGNPTSLVFWISIILMAVLFAAGHLPALKGLVGKVSPLMLSRTLILNIPLAVVCGWLYWKYGIEAAIITHFSADLIYHGGGTVILRSKLG
jgi:hypothetical protein